MAARSQLLYSAAAIRRLLDLPASATVQIKEFGQVLWVWVQGQRPTFVSKADLKQHFVQRRQAEAQKLTVVDWLRTPECYTVRSQQGDKDYWVTCTDGALRCTCADYQRQLTTFGRGCCKHGYAVLQHLGYSSLQTYQADRAVHASSLADPRTAHQSTSSDNHTGGQQLKLLAS